MKHHIPAPILRRMLLLAGSIFALVVAGVIWGIVTNDKTILMLTFALLITGVFKITTLYQTVIVARYDVYDGTVILNRPIPLRKRHEVQIVDADGTTVQLFLSGHSSLREGTNYRVYIQKEPDGFSEMNFPDSLRPARTLLGAEQVSA